MLKQIALLYLLLLPSFLSLYDPADEQLTTSLENIPKEEARKKKKDVEAKAPFYISPKIGEVKHHGFLVQFKNIRAMDVLESAIRGSSIQTFDRFPFALVNGTLERITTTLRDIPAVKGVYPNQICTVAGRVHRSDSPSTHPTSLTTANAINATYVRKQGYTGEGIQVAIVDTGINPHEALDGRVVKEKSFIQKEYGYERNIDDTDDEVGHGTAVAGLVAGKGSSEVEGIAPGAELFNAKVFPDQQTGATDAGIIAAIEWAVKEGAEVINLSLGRPPLKKDPLERVVNQVSSEGVLVTVAAGNEGDPNGANTMSVSSPGTARDAITVGASQGNESVGYFTSRGPTTDTAVKPDLIAPGVNVTVLKGTDETAVGSGTSFAAPHVAGAISLLLDFLQDEGGAAQYPHLIKGGLIKGALINTSSALIGDELTEGGGIINVGNAFTEMKQALNNDQPITAVLPRQLPINSPVQGATSCGFPYFQKLYMHSTTVFNFSVTKAQEANLSIRLSGNMTDVIELNTLPVLSVTHPTNYWEMNFTVKNGAVGSYAGAICFRHNATLLAKVPMRFKLTRPRGRLLFDVKHTSWTFSAKYGQYHKFYQLADSLNISVRQYFPTSPQLTPSFLQAFDLLFMPDTLTGGALTETEKHALYNFTAQGGLIIFLAMSPGDGVQENNRTAVNDFLRKFGVKLGYRRIGETTEEGEAKTVAVNVEEESVFGIGSPDALPFWGDNLIPLDWKSSPILKASPGIYDLTVGTFSRMGEGGIFISGSNFFLDTWAFLGKYGLQEEVTAFAKRLLSWGVVKEAFQATSTIGPFKKGATENISCMYNGSAKLNASSLQAYHLDAIGMRPVELARSGSTFEGSFVMRNARDNYLLLSASFGGWLLGTRLNYSAVPQEREKPSILNITPKNQTVKEVQSTNEISTFTLNIRVRDNDSGVLEEAIKSRVRGASGTGYQHSRTTETENNTTSRITITIDQEVLRDPLSLLVSRNEAQFSVELFIPDENLNAVNLVVEFTIRQEINLERILLIVALSIVLLLLFLGVAIWIYEKKME